MRKIIVSIFLVLTFLCSCSEMSETAVDWFDKADALRDGEKYTDPKKAIEYLNNAIKLKPDLAEAYHIRGITYAKLNQYQRAIEDFNEAIRLQPNDAEAYQSRGVTRTALLQYQRAIEDFNTVIRLKPDNADAYKCRGYVYFNQGNKKLGCPDAKKPVIWETANCQKWLTTKDTAVDLKRGL